uniref:Reverse transcriptase zinc-binding domain-containing protein n=1 Tax=Cajanus cajan TaxID=3821 RepID=A0A151T6N3_CAJCA|nr:hypothetical protein KK1_017260 [Cajanus cajan]
MVANAFSNGVIEPALTETLIVPIPKVDIPMSFKDFKPISLCNVLFKTISKIIHHMHKKKGKKGYVMFKVEFEKAYDMGDWNFLKLTLTDFGFPLLLFPFIYFLFFTDDCLIFRIYWNFNILATRIPNEGKKELMDHVLNEDVEDAIIWSHSLNDIYSSNLTFNWLFVEKPSPIFPLTNWSCVWKFKLLKNILHFLWLTLHGSLLTNVFRV